MLLAADLATVGLGKLSNFKFMQIFNIKTCTRSINNINKQVAKF